MTPEHLDQLKRQWDQSISEFGCRGCDAILMFQGRVLQSPLPGGLCHECQDKAALAAGFEGELGPDAS
jgi:hypothetical protein